jgi:cellulose synthase/poly-beta-1,6-N-acetylglucosamine synthase-like glycosyltransferase
MVLFNAGLWVLLVLYLIFIVVMYIGTYRRRPQRREDTPFVSILVAARNEAQNIRQCVLSLANQDYPRAAFEIVVADHQSIDGTAAVVEQLRGQVPNLRLITVQDQPDGLAGKQQALDQGIAASQGEIILSTDADCRAPATWARSLAACFVPGVDLVCGHTVTGGKRTLWHELQQIDYVYLLTLAQGFIGLGRPVSCMGTNLGFRKEAYVRLGGFAGIGPAITEDHALCRAMAAHDRRSVVFNSRADALITTAPVATLGAFLRQRQRWVAGGLGRGVLAPLVLWMVLTLHLSVVAALCLCAGNVWQVVLSVSYFFLLMGMNLPIILRGSAQIRDRGLLGNALTYQVFYVFYTIVTAGLVLGGGQMVWKDKIYKKT